MSAPDHPVPVEIHTSLAVSRWREVLPAADVFRAAETAACPDARGRSIGSSTPNCTTRPSAPSSPGARRPRGRGAVPLARRCVGRLGSRREHAFATGGRRGSAALDAHLGLASMLFGATGLPEPRSTLRVRAHLSMCELELVSPGAARASPRRCSCRGHGALPGCAGSTATGTCGGSEAATSGGGSGLREQPAVLQLRLDVVAVHQRDEVDRDLLRARRLALAVVGAGAEVLLHGLDHGLDARSSARPDPAAAG